MSSSSNLSSPNPTQTVNILICGPDGLLVELFEDLVAEVVSPEVGVLLDTDLCDVLARDTEVLAKLGKEDYDLIILWLNNILVDSPQFASEIKCHRPLKLVRHIRNSTKAKIIGLYGSPDEDSYIDDAVTAGADFCLRMPCPLENLAEALKGCLPSGQSTSFQRA